MVPPDVLLRAGVRITIFSKDAWEKVVNGEKLEGDDQTKVRVLELAYTHCYPSGCFTAADATAEIIAMLRDGGGLAVSATVRSRGEPATFQVSLAGFAEALAGEPLSLGAWLKRRGK
jgi:invasion protein IalB